MNPQHRKEHNLTAVVFVVVLLVIALVGGAKGHTERALTAKNPQPAAASPAVARPIIKNSALLADAVAPTALMPSITATAALVQDITQDKPIFDLRSTKQWSAASLTKLVTAMSALETYNDDQREELDLDVRPLIKVSAKAIATESAAGNLVAGRSYLLSELLRAMLVFSSNDAAAAISEYFGGDKFIDFMNERATEIGMRDTRFFDPHGLSPLNLTTARDLELLVRYIYGKERYLFRITQEKIEGGTHPFAGQPDFLGGKTGFIDESAGNLISLFDYQGHPVVIIVLGSKQRAEDTQILKDWFLPAKN